MAESDRINLLEEFESQEDNQFVLLSTYSFDPIFFDAYLMDKLRKNNGAKIVVLVDADTHRSKYGDFTSRTGREYLLIPVDSQSAVFHPKVSLFFSEREEKATTYVSSANLTQQGFTSNIETVTKVEHDLSSGSSEFLDSVLDFFEELSEMSKSRDYSEVIENEILGSRVIDSDTEDSGEEYSFLTNSMSQGSILEQLTEEIDETEFESVTLSAPFFSPNAKVLERLSDEIDFDEVRLLLQKNNHNLNSIEEYEEVCEELGCSLEVNKIENDRISHAKLLELDGKDSSYHLVGSANMTQSALLETWETGNVEAAVLVEADREVHADVFDMEKQDEIDELLSDSVTDWEGDGSGELLITSAKYENEWDRLTVETVEKEGEGKLRIKTTGSGGSKEESISLSEGKQIVNVSDGKPTEVDLEYNGETDRRKIFTEEDSLSRIAERTSSSSFEKIPKRFFGESKTDFTRVISFYRNTNASLEMNVSKSGNVTSADDVEEESEGGGEDGEDEYGDPSQIRTSTVSGLRGILKEISGMVGKIREKKQLEEDLEHTAEQKMDALEEVRLTDEDWDNLNRLLERFISKSQSVLEEKRNHAEDSEQGWLSLQPVFIKSFLILLSEVEHFDRISNDVFEEFDEAIEENIDNLDIHGIEDDKEAKRNLFAYLLVYNLINRRKGRGEINPEHGSENLVLHFYEYDELLSNEDVRRRRGEVSEFIEGHFDSLEFNRNEFAEAYAKLAGPSINKKNKKEALVAVCDYLTDETDEGIIKLYEESLREQERQYDIKGELKREIERLPEPSTEQAMKARRVILDAEEPAKDPLQQGNKWEDPEVPSEEELF